VTRVLWSLIFAALVGGFGAMAVYSGWRGRWVESGVYLIATSLLACLASDALVPLVVALGVVGGFSLGRVNR
jgi:hypothetical protein